MHSNMKPTADSDLKPATVGTLPRIDTIIRRRMHTLGSPLEDDQTRCRQRHAGKLQWKHGPRASFFRMNVDEVLGRA
jgi:hypothetical protein